MTLSVSVIDSHAHLSMTAFDEDRDQVVQNAFREDVSAILCPGEITDPCNLHISLELADTYKTIIAAAGVHPHQAKKFHRSSRAKIEELAGENRIRAVGEIGLDFHYNFSSPESQEKAFREQLNTAQELKLPAIIHSRDAAARISLAIKEEGFTQGGILHCFTENWEYAQNMIDQGFYISFSGIVTFPKAFPLRDVAKKVPLERLLVETDSPYLVPIPFRGKVKRNEPKYVRITAQYLAELRAVPENELFKATTQNFQTLFSV